MNVFLRNSKHTVLCQEFKTCFPSEEKFNQREQKGVVFIILEGSFIQTDISPERTRKEELTGSPQLCVRQADFWR